MKVECLFVKVGIGLIGFLFMGALFAQDVNLRLFHIERNKNKNIVCYDLCIHNGTIDAKNPVKAYWVNMPQKSREELSSIEKKYAYGWECKKIKENTYQMTMAAFKERTVTVTYDPKKNVAEAYVVQNGKKIQIKKIEANTKPPLHMSVNYVKVHGVDKNSGEKIIQQIM